MTKALHNPALARLSRATWLAIFCLFATVVEASAPVCPPLLAAKTLVVVDGLSDGAGYAIEARKMFPGIKILHVASSPELPKGLRDSFQPESYDGLFTFSEAEYTGLLSQLRGYPGLQILAGTETGVALADRLSRDLHTLSNGTHKSAARTDKRLLAQVMAPLLKDEPSIHTVPGEAFSAVANALDFIAQASISFPVVAKPTESAGNYGFTIAHSVRELEATFTRLVGTTDPLGKPIRELLIQPRLLGRIIAVNTVSHPQHGQVVTDMWVTEVKFVGKNIVFLRSWLAPFDPKNPQHQRRARAASLVARGLDVDFGPLHPEFLETDQGDLYVLDVGARPAGGALPRVARRCGANDQIRTSLLAAFAPQEFLELSKAGPQLEREGALIQFVSPVQGIVRSVPSEAEMRARIPGFVSADFHHMQVGQPLEVSSSLFNQPGFVFVQGDRAVIEKAEAAVRQWEATSFYDVTPTAH